MCSSSCPYTSQNKANHKLDLLECIKIADIDVEVTVVFELRKSTVGVIYLDGATIFEELALGGVAAHYGGVLVVFAGMGAVSPSTRPRLWWALAVGYVFCL